MLCLAHLKLKEMRDGAGLHLLNPYIDTRSSQCERSQLACPAVNARLYSELKLLYGAHCSAILFNFYPGVTERVLSVFQCQEIDVKGTPYAEFSLAQVKHTKWQGSGCNDPCQRCH